MRRCTGKGSGLRAQGDGALCYLGAAVRGQIVGFVLVMFANKQDVMPHTGGAQCLDMVDLYVAQEYRGRGIGSVLITAAEQACRERGVPFLGLDVNPTDNGAARRLYERHGYQVVGALHLDGIYPSKDEQEKDALYEDWCVDMIKWVSQG